MGDQNLGDGDLDDPEPPPTGHSGLSGIYAAETPFGDPPEEPVTLVGKVPWELADPEGAPAEE